MFLLECVIYYTPFELQTRKLEKNSIIPNFEHSFHSHLFSLQSVYFRTHSF